MTPERRNELIAEGLLEELFAEVKAESLKDEERAFYTRLEGDYERNKRYRLRNQITQDTAKVEEQRIVDALLLGPEAEKSVTKEAGPMGTPPKRRFPFKAVLLGGLGLVGAAIGLIYGVIMVLSPQPGPTDPLQQSVLITLFTQETEAKLGDSKIFVFLNGAGGGRKLGADDQVQLMLTDALRMRDSLCVHIVSKEWILPDSIYCFPTEDSIQTILVQLREKGEDEPENSERVSSRRTPQLFSIQLQHDAAVYKYKTVLLDGKAAVVTKHLPNFKDIKVPALNRAYELAFVREGDTLFCGSIFPETENQRLNTPCP